MGGKSVLTLCAEFLLLVSEYRDTSDDFFGTGRKDTLLSMLGSSGSQGFDVKCTSIPYRCSEKNNKSDNLLPNPLNK